ncbi:dihydrofolate reductase [Neptuniibacter sp. QD37_11]|uniref:dihydrofolate reductase n=1 Tax=Neptuniibacter sp. QD37_11 TaxID=3398209 RepID=UPI0039F4C493
MIKAIAAVGQAYELGKGNELLWTHPEDFKHFVNYTRNHVVIMGLNTYRSLPKALKGRTVLVLTSHPNGVELLQDSDIVLSGFTPDRVVDYAKSLLNEKGHDGVVVAGGGYVYGTFAPYVDELSLTYFEASDKNADAYFPADQYKTLLKGKVQELLTITGADNKVGFVIKSYRAN